MQTYCGLLDCTDNSTEAGLSLWRLLKSCISYTFSILRSCSFVVLKATIRH